MQSQIRMPLEADLCTDYVRVGGGMLLSPRGRRWWHVDPILVAASCTFRLAGQHLVAVASKRHPFGHNIVFRFVFCYYDALNAMWYW